MTLFTLLWCDFRSENAKVFRITTVMLFRDIHKETSTVPRPIDGGNE